MSIIYLSFIFQYLGVESLKSLRHVCRFLHQYIEQSEQILFKEWRLRGELSAVRLELFSDEVATITGKTNFRNINFVM